ncbi:MAG: hypothetical protein Q9162_004695 [Coniocarpon cinnabarinum]
MSWLPRVSSLGRFSPFSGTPKESPASPAARVTEDDFSYITSEDLQRETSNQQASSHHHSHTHSKHSSSPDRRDRSSSLRKTNSHTPQDTPRGNDTSLRKSSSHTASGGASLGVPLDTHRTRSRSRSRARHPSLERERQTRPSGRETDVITFRYKGQYYPVHFPAWAIDEYSTTAGSAREMAARRVDADAKRVRMFWRGRNLKDDAVPLREIGMRSQDQLEVMVVVGDRDPGSDMSSEDEDGSVASDLPDGDGRKGESRRRRKNRRGGKKPRKGVESGSSRGESPAYSGPAGGGAEHLPMPSGTHPLHKTSTSSTPARNSPVPSSAPSSAPPPPAAPTTPAGKIQALEDKFRTEYQPVCEGLIANPPREKEKREFEHKKITETIMTQVMLKLDGVETEGDEYARGKRKALVKELQGWFNRVDEVVKR